MEWIRVAVVSQSRHEEVEHQEEASNGEPIEQKDDGVVWLLDHTS
jgi:hypothetical protein